MSIGLGDDWHCVGTASEFEDEDVQQACIGGHVVAIYCVKGELFATDDICTHEHAYLSDGVVVDDIVECPMHQGRFHIPSGKAMSAPVVEPLGTYPVQVIEDKIYVRLVGPDDSRELV